jgi:hypothetical protein
MTRYFFFFIHKDPSSDQSLSIEQKDDDHQEIVPSTRSTSMHFQKQSSPIDPDEGSLKETIA